MILNFYKVTISSAIQKRAQDIIASSPANVPALPSKTSAVIAQASQSQPKAAKYHPTTTTNHSPAHFARSTKQVPSPQKRTVTSTIVISTVTVYATSTANVFSVASYLVTVSSSTTIWLTSTTVLNAQKTVYTTTTTDNVQTAAVQTSTTQSGTSSNNNNAANKTANNDTGNGNKTPSPPARKSASK